MQTQTAIEEFKARLARFNPDKYILQYEECCWTPEASYEHAKSHIHYEIFVVRAALEGAGVDPNALDIALFMMATEAMKGGQYAMSEDDYIWALAETAKSLEYPHRPATLPDTLLALALKMGVPSDGICDFFINCNLSKAIFKMLIREYHMGEQSNG